MPYVCAAVNCTSGYKAHTTAKSVSFHRFPLKDPVLLGKWVRNMHRVDFVPTDYSRLCSLHFEKDEFQTLSKDSNRRRSKGRDSSELVQIRLSDNAVPTLFQMPSYLLREKSEERQTVSKTSSSARREVEERQNDELAEEFLETDKIRTLEDIENQIKSARILSPLDLASPGKIGTDVQLKGKDNPSKTSKTSKSKKLQNTTPNTNRKKRTRKKKIIRMEDFHDKQHRRQQETIRDRHEDGKGKAGTSQGETTTEKKKKRDRQKNRNKSTASAGDSPSKCPHNNKTNLGEKNSEFSHHPPGYTGNRNDSQYKYQEFSGIGRGMGKNMPKPGRSGQGRGKPRNSVGKKLSNIQQSAEVTAGTQMKSVTVMSVTVTESCAAVAVEPNLNEIPDDPYVPQKPNCPKPPKPKEKPFRKAKKTKWKSFTPTMESQNAYEDKLLASTDWAVLNSAELLEEPKSDKVIAANEEKLTKSTKKSEMEAISGSAVAASSNNVSAALAYQLLRQTDSLVDLETPQTKCGKKQMNENIVGKQDRQRTVSISTELHSQSQFDYQRRRVISDSGTTVKASAATLLYAELRNDTPAPRNEIQDAKDRHLGNATENVPLDQQNKYKPSSAPSSSAVIDEAPSSYGRPPQHLTSVSSPSPQPQERSGLMLEPHVYIDSFRKTYLIDIKEGKITIHDLTITWHTEKKFRRVVVSKVGTLSPLKGVRCSGESLLRKETGVPEIRSAVEEAIHFVGRIHHPLTVFSRDKREPIMQTSLKFLESEHIYELKMKSDRFREAIYFCRVCDFHLNSVNHCRSHIMVADHVKGIEMRALNDTLNAIPVPSDSHLEALEAFVRATALSQGMEKNELKQCQEVAVSVESVLRISVHAECAVRVYGSCLTGMALQDSNLNLELLYPHREMNHAQALLSAHKVLLNTPNAMFSDVVLETNTRWPFVSFRIPNILPRTKCVLSVGNRQAWEISSLIGMYADFWPLLKPLGQTLRVWAKVCHVADFATGGLPTYCLDLMLIHYLQSIKPNPLLPVLSDRRQEEKTDNESTVSLICLDDDFRKQVERTLEDFVKPKDDENGVELGKLWLGFFKFYCLEKNSQATIIQIRSRETVTREEKGWNRKRFGIEDPFMPKKNLSQLSGHMFEYISNCLQFTYKYFGIPRTVAGPLLHYEDRQLRMCKHVEDAITGGESGSDLSVEEITEHLKQTLNLPHSSTDLANANSNANPLRKGDSAETPQVSSDKSEDETEDFNSIMEVVRSVVMDMLDTIHLQGNTIRWEDRRPFSLLLKKLRSEDFHFSLSERDMTGGQRRVVGCLYCGGVGHKREGCPEKRLPPLHPLTPLDRLHLNTQRNFFNEYQKNFQIDNNRYQKQQIFLRGLQAYLCARLRPDVQLHLFGSSQNGFGFHDSDLDICLTFQNQRDLPPNVEPVTFIRQIARALRSDRDFQGIVPVTQAKVPIVKFYSRGLRLEADISLYNVLALRNTEMLRLYSDMDPRVRQLGYVVKMFAKYCDIGDASRGSLSSYAYILMLIHYLQRCSPPIVPVLQDLCRPPDTSCFEMDGWDTYFFPFLQQLPQVWPHHAQNRASVPELWIGFLRYYTEEFQFDDEVIQIRRLQPMTKFEKLWTDKPMTIEDPFDLSHNLGSGLSKKMFNYILRSFHQSRWLFGSQSTYDDILDFQGHGSNPTPQTVNQFYKNYMPLKDALPRDRVCKCCGHVGHFVENCPHRRQNRRGGGQVREDDDHDPSTQHSQARMPAKQSNKKDSQGSSNGQHSKPFKKHPTAPQKS